MAVPARQLTDRHRAVGGPLALGHTGTDASCTLCCRAISFLQLTSSVIATIALSLTIPLAIIADRIFGFEKVLYHPF